MTTSIVPTEGEGPSDPADPPTELPVAEGDEVTVASPDETAARSRRRRRWILGFLIGAALVGAVLAAFLVPLPYYLVQPGSVRPAEQRIEIEGADSFETDGEVLFTTVYVNRATLALLIRAQLDDAIEIRTESEMYPDGDRDASRQLNQQRMDLSKLTATRVALEQVGIEAAYLGDGARVIAVSPDAPSNSVLEAGDVIVEVDGQPVAMPSDIGEHLGGFLPGETVPVRLRRVVDGAEAELDVKVELTETAETPGRPILGITADPSNPRIDSDVQVAVDSGRVSGPSAGLAWTLAIIDRLTPGSITGGERIAVTGTIADDGTVGPIGGVVQKVAAVKRAGLRTFIYPASTSEDEQAQMRRVTGDDVELVPVDTVDEAVEFLVPGGLQAPA